MVRVVVADADGHTRNLVHLAFASDDWSVREAVDATGAVRVIAAEVPEVVVVAADLPPVGGLAVARAMRQNPQTAAVGLVVLVDPAHPADADAVDQVDAQVLERPLDTFGLLDAIEQVLASR